MFFRFIGKTLKKRQTSSKTCKKYFFENPASIWNSQGGLGLCLAH